MKFNCGPTTEERREYLANWHPFFAVLPRRVGSHDCRWFEWIERKGSYIIGRSGVWWNWKYRARQEARP